MQPSLIRATWIGRRAPIAFFVLAALAASPASAAPSKSTGTHPLHTARIDPAIAVYAATTLGRAGVAPALRPFVPATVPITIEWAHPPTTTEVAAAEKAGAVIQRDEAGRPLGARGSKPGRVVAAEAPTTALSALSALTTISKIRLDAPVLPSPRPLDYTAGLVGAKDTWGMRTSDGMPLTGTGITICDVDSGIDVLHPMMFRADGGYFDWIDENENGRFDLGIDTVDLGAGPIVVNAMNGIVSEYYDETPLFGSDDPDFDPKLDFLYADENANGLRDAGSAKGFTEDTPTYGERLLVLDDVNQNGALDVGEKLVSLKTSKIKSFRLNNKTYRRGTDLIEAPYDASMLHGVGATTVLAGGVPGLTGLVGMAPDAELVMATDTQGGRDFQMTSFCLAEKARVVLHEYAPWVGYHLDGSSPTEQLIDSSSADGVVHVNPAGNLSTSQKLYKRVVASGSVTPITIEVPSMGIEYWVSSVLWRDTARDLTMTLAGPDGTTKAVDVTPNGAMIDWGGGLTLYSQRIDSDRGTARVDVYLVSPNMTPVPVPPGTYTLTVTDPSPAASPPLTLIAYTQDEISGWGKGAAFPDYSSEEHLVGYPGTADHGMPISAFTAHNFGTGTPGARAYYSGRGHRIDGKPIMWISGPDNPITSARFDDRELSYMVYGGTSGASPHVAGSSALILEHDPSLTGDQVKDLIKAGASTDSFTGAVPNDDFGWGKVDVYRSIFKADRPSGSAPTVHASPVTMSPGTVDAAFVASDPDEASDKLVVEIDRDYDGVYDDKIVGSTMPLSYDEVGDYRVKLRVTDSTGKSSATLVSIHVAAQVGAGGAGGSGVGGATGIDVAGGGPGCAVTSTTNENCLVLDASALLLLVACTRRKRSGR